MIVITHTHWGINADFYFRPLSAPFLWNEKWLRFVRFSFTLYTICNDNDNRLIHNTYALQTLMHTLTPIFSVCCFFFVLLLQILDTLIHFISFSMLQIVGSAINIFSLFSLEMCVCIILFRLFCVIIGTQSVHIPGTIVCTYKIEL